jgi:hypothetical protein
MRPGVVETEFDQAIRKAKADLDQFERGTSARELLTRLRASDPFHPWLILRASFLFLTMVLTASAIVALVLPFLHHDIAEVVGMLDAAAGVPLPGILAFLVPLFFLMALGAHFLALVAARNAPLLAHEAKTHQRLVSDVKQLEAQRSVQLRMTPMTATPRIHTRS